MHITPRNAWETARQAGEYRAPSLETEGFIHFSTPEQVPATLARFYAGQRDLVLLEVDPTRLVAPLRYEPAASGELFPHLYGPLNLDAVVGTREIE